jgi:hypothetical protein
MVVNRIKIFAQLIVAVFFDVEKNPTDINTYRLFHVCVILDSSAVIAGLIMTKGFFANDFRGSIPFFLKYARL